MYLIAVLPPGNIQRRIADMKKMIFEKLGYGSAYALPPLIPLFASSDPAGFPEPPPRLREPIETAGPLISGNAVYLSLRNPEVVVDIRDAIRQSGAGSPRSRRESDGDLQDVTSGFELFDIRPGVFLCMNEYEDRSPEVSALDFPELRWRSCPLVRLEIQSTEGSGEFWWHRVFWYERERARIRSPL